MPIAWYPSRWWMYARRLVYARRSKRKDQENIFIMRVRVSDTSFSHLICTLKKIKWWVEKHVINMSSFEFGLIEVASKDFYKQRQITDIFTIDVN